MIFITKHHLQKGERRDDSFLRSKRGESSRPVLIMKEYVITYPEILRELCIKNNWFTCGSNEQYERLFYANQNGFTIDQISIIIWICSKTDNRREITEKLIKARKEYDRDLADAEEYPDEKGGNA